MKKNWILIVFFLNFLLSCENAPQVNKVILNENGIQKTLYSHAEYVGMERGMGNSYEYKNEKSLAMKGHAQDLEKIQPFYIFSDKGSRYNHYVASGFMPDSNCVDFDDNWTQDCKEGATCIKITYDLECSRKNQKWAGIYWQNPANNWGQRKGGYNLTGAQRLIFWAKGDKGGEQIQEFITGGIMGDYPDTDMAMIGPVILTSEWKKYVIDLRGKNLFYISGGFGWSTSEGINGETCIFYLDEIRFE